jgi:hypothetical protein
MMRNFNSLVVYFLSIKMKVAILVGSGVVQVLYRIPVSGHWPLDSGNKSVIAEILSMMDEELCSSASDPPEFRRRIRNVRS